MSMAYVQAVGLLAPGMPSWEAGAAVLAGHVPYQLVPIPPVQANLLPPNERRRAPLGVRMALQACEDAMRNGTVESRSDAQKVPGGVPAASRAFSASDRDSTVPGADPHPGLNRAAHLSSVFVSSDADMEIIHRICSALAETQRVISPTDFHNSVHNAAAGYWGIASAARSASTTIAAYDYCVATGLREALAKLSVDDVDVLLVAYDVPPPPPLYATRPISQPAAIALWLTRQATARTLARIALCVTDKEDLMTEPALEALRQSNPALRALPLLQALARRRTAKIGLRADARQWLGIELQLA